ncbi:MAG: 50S ribosomal protein L15 [Deltaproteobacteria bacterium CG_4_8_14_3_um_filter_51_11]|nr:50S ribosomal protein L15 [bacterium]OIP39430.1 MAG: 50S ribosomal protein L15 [Desulfobacteraceae bacterium CG2_30_51_40]PIP45311.1 MAG: 50S ribosomal protein L15 [Deltaproteobacteria bacterium CG23_combo_of_CG06-09_8_20_14_all_51_20]PIX21060.1 MAG: 50S ribosomal protein L15 [Deltaproteobacteria bacterium CG_4_8_14_3_um_filter_51_11]PIY22943.1 MAG: 50S ribosomal protein L15 [Deltaproteobacteria bacterium CG_4_10_14_3_um_filter_51_14]PJB36963.1 MAG: 50S ribosomal protein L15 [Deltaproteobac
MRLNELSPAEGARKKRKRIGRGPGSGHGKTACKGNKGQNARSGGGVRPGFEGGQMPLQRRLPKRGFKNPFRVEYQVVNVKDLGRFDSGSVVESSLLEQAGLIRSSKSPVKLLGEGDIASAVTVRVNRASRSAIEKVSGAGGSVEIL